MTIREMQKLYKKVFKVANEYDNAIKEAKITYSNGCVEEVMQVSKRIEKSAKSIVKLATETLNLAKLYDNPVEKLLEEFTCGEENFIRWAVVCEVNWNDKMIDPEVETEE